MLTILTTFYGHSNILGISICKFTTYSEFEVVVVATFLTKL